MPVPMLVPINPMIDSAFKALFATPEHRHLLTSLLNAIVQPEVPIVDLEYLDPTDEPDRLEGHRTIVDVKVRDSTGHVYQIEVQVVLHQALAERMLLTWARLYDRQFTKGQVYTDLLPVTSVWILDRRLHDDGRPYRRYSLRDAGGQELTSHCNVHVVELANLPRSEPHGVLENWLYFLKNARSWTTLPERLDHGILQEAMEIMKTFSEDDVQYWRYIAELDAQTVDMTRKKSMATALSQLSEAERAVAELGEALASKDEALASNAEALASNAEALASNAEALASNAEALASKDAELARLTELVRTLSGDSD